MNRARTFQQKVDLPGILGQFLGNAKLEDLVVELVQNEVDAASSKTVISFSDTALICEGNGAYIDGEGWERLELVLGAGGKTRAKHDGIGAKNHGLRTGFRLGDEIQVRSNGERVDLVLFQFPKSRELDPGVWPRIPDLSGPPQGTRITIPYRTRSLHVPSGEEFDLAPPTTERLRTMFDEAVRDVPSRLIATVLAGKRYELELVWRGLESHRFIFECKPARLRGWPGLLRRTCEHIDVEDNTELLIREAVAEFPITLARDDRAKVPRFFRRAEGIVGEISLAIDATGRPYGCDGKLRYPISYPNGASDAYSGHGFHVSAPFISDTTRHGLASSSERNYRLLAAARSAAAQLFKRQLIPRYGPAVLELVRQPSRPDPAAEIALCETVLAAKALLICPKSDRGEIGRQRFQRGDDPLVAAFHADHPNEIVPQLFVLAPVRSQLLAAGTPTHVVETLRLLAGGTTISAWTDLDAVRELIPASAAAREALQAEGVSSAQVRATERRLALAQRALDRGTLPDGLVEALRSNALLPTASAGWMPWPQVYFTRQPAPAIPGLVTSPTIHRGLASLRLLREGPIKLQRFKIDTYLENARVADLPASSKERFFSWLAKNHSALLPQTLTHLAKQAIWPSENGAFLALDELLSPKSPQLADLLKKVVPSPRADLRIFPGMRRSRRGVLYLRAWPSEGELQNWYNKQAVAIEDLNRGEPDAHSDVAAAVEQLELDMQYLLSEPQLCGFVPIIAAAHRTIDGTGNLATIRVLHDRGALAVLVCDLDPRRLTGGVHRDLYLKLGVKVSPDPDAILEALERRSASGETLFRRLDAFSSRANADLLADRAIIPADEQMRCLGDLYLSHPQNLDLWGEWKRAWSPPGLSPDRVSLLINCGVARFLTETLSLGFFTWLSHQDAKKQARHLAQAVRHLRDRQHGPLKWWEGRSSLPCLPVRGPEGEIEFVSHARATSVRSSIYLPDFPPLHDALLANDRSKRLAITDVEGVSGTLFSALRSAGVRSLRRALGRPTTFTAAGDASPGGSALQSVLQRLQSERMILELPKRLERHGVAQEHLRGSWRSLLRNLTGIRIAQDLRATFELTGRSYTVTFAAGVDPRTGLVWLDGSRPVGVQIYEAIGNYLLGDDADPLSSYALMLAVEMPFEASARAPEDTGDVEGDALPSNLPEPSSGETIGRAERGHGISEADRRAAVPHPEPFRPLSHATNTPKTSSSQYRNSRPRAPASTEYLRGSVEELEQILRLKEDHYAWHCQACLGDREVAQATPPDTYVSLSKYRQGLIEAHHVQHLQNEGAPGAANLLALCRFHHDLLGDQVSRQAVSDALGAAKGAVRTFPNDTAEPYQLAGFVAKLKLDVAPFEVHLFFTDDHRKAWLPPK
ncbi:hypothetical protein [Mesorhizobium sp. B2-3-6]|uniref:hypothetical protein n=1 Tax=Mesorhizobium sp. B2-3-6 TaxID=2589957 RepID=UPI001129360B|nr:hypothetical protein [Mesorhizobium sp. B2-3-6]TPM23818.1 hypothetical protein FJ953_04845 [Mesorhizobium sp. B2-3-6]